MYRCSGCFREVDRVESMTGGSDMPVSFYCSPCSDYKFNLGMTLGSYDWSKLKMTSKKIYVASSWRNAAQPAIVALLRSIGHDVYDFRDPAHAFGWKEIEAGWQSWTPAQFREALKTEPARRGFEADRIACEGADATVLVMPCGRSAHLELGVAVGMGQKTAVYIPHGAFFEPELMYKWCDLLLSEDELRAWAAAL